MRATTPDRIKDQAARAEAWKAYAMRMVDRAEAAHERWMDAETYGIREESRMRDEEIREMERDARENARAAYAEGYWKAREEGGDW